MIESSKQVRVDNWGVFFLQRLQMFFSKTDYCDLTLQFQGNVQLKVHRLVMNACTEYFTFLEQSCPSQEENTILMPPDLQADVIVPIVNFMYTGMLEFHISIFEKLYNVAELMDITVLTKLLDAQKGPMQGLKQQQQKKKQAEAWTAPKKAPPKTSTPELPATLPGRKLPVWKRKNAPSSATQSAPSQVNFMESKWTPDPLNVPDNAPKPTRFEWPDDDLPPINLMDTSFEEISYTSRPLLTQEEEIRAGTSFDEVRNNAGSNSKKAAGKSSSGGHGNMLQAEDYVKEHRIRVDFETTEEGEYEFMEVGQKRKLENATKASPKRQKLNDKENKETTISVKSNNGAELDHTKIVSEILKKYPQLVKKNKNIRLKIMASGNKNVTEPKTSVKSSTKTNVNVEVNQEKIVKPVKQPQKPVQEKQQFNEEGPWTCRRCIEAGEVPQEFVLYYLYRKHMTDVHNEAFDLRLCKYCGRKCGKHNLMMYHLYTKHGLKPPPSYNFPKCDQCPFIALSVARLNEHKLRHSSDEMQCLDCKLAFASQHALTSHMRATGHYSKTGKSSYDCQYCTKKLQSAINLFSHIKNSHLKEARRAEIVSLDEMDDVDEANEDEDEQEEAEEEQKYIVPETVQDVTQKDKVKIISNVKVPGRSDQASNTQQVVPLVPSSEAESLNNVASGIATSLGLVDIVVLDENQQYILQQQENQGEQTEYILPELAPGENYSGQVITTQHSTVLQQGMLQSTASDIGSTDELVMVLTDHDYQDDHEGSATDNSNIVVLYSHPVDGQQGQFITSQGNLLVNSQTGMLEIRNSAAIATTTANEIVVNNEVEAPIESIEMIQREIESHSDMKQDLCYSTAKNPEVQQKSEENSEQPEEQLILNELPNEISVEGQEEAENEEENETENAEAEQEPEAQNEETSKEQIEETPQPEENQDAEPKQADESENQDKVDGAAMDLEEPMEIDEIETTGEQDTTNEELNTEEEEASTEQEASELPAEVTSDAAKTADKEVEESIDVPPERPNVTISLPVYGTSETAVINDPSILQEVHEEKRPEVKCTNEEPNGSLDDVPEEPMEVDGPVEEQQPQEEEEPVAEVVEKEPEKVEEESREAGQEEESQDEKDKEVESEAATTVAEPEPQAQQEEVSDAASEYQQQSEASNDDDNSQSSQEQAQTTESQSSINQTILDDWEDTDSQHSEKQRVAMKEAAENVNKLMDDWEEEDEDDKKETD